MIYYKIILINLYFKLLYNIYKKFEYNNIYNLNSIYILTQ